jgi:hypothetical protein
MRHTQIGEAYPGALGPLGGPRIAAMDAEANARLERELTRPQATHCACGQALPKRYDCAGMCIRCRKREWKREIDAASKASHIPVPCIGGCGTLLTWNGRHRLRCDECLRERNRERMRRRSA